MTTIDSFDGHYRFLSNFWPCRIVGDDGITYPSTEHAYQAAKTLDLEKRRVIAKAETPGRAKRLGKQHKMRPDWDNVKLSTMQSLLQQKFGSNLELCRLLLSTGEAELVEGNTWGDVFWGVCRGQGENHLGKLLMQVRRDIYTRLLA